jgi:hypothetical protein
MLTLNSFGMRPVYHPSGVARATAYIGGIATGFASDLYQGTPVALATTGLLALGANAADFIGAFSGVEYTDANGRRQFSKRWVASTAATEIIAYVYDDPEIVYEAQVNGVAAQTAVGDQANFSAVGGLTVGAGNNTTQLSTMALDATLAGAGAQGMLRVLDKSLTPGNDWGDAFTILRVTIARHQYVSNKVAI